MREYLEIGTSPTEEDCVQVGSDNYRNRARAEAFRFIELLRKTFGYEPDGAELTVKWFDHDFGPYCEVVCYYDTDLPESIDYAFRCESEAPEYWE
jgi:hypothetical protein